MLPNVGDVMPLANAVALDYVHVLHVDGKTLRSLAQDFPESLRTLRMWSARSPALELVPRAACTVFDVRGRPALAAMINGIKEYMLYVLRTATNEERRAAKMWVATGVRPAFFASSLPPRLHTREESEPDKGSAAKQTSEVPGVAPRRENLPELAI